MISFFLCSIPTSTYEKIKNDPEQLHTLLSEEKTYWTSFEHDAEYDLNGLRQFGIEFDYSRAGSIGEHQFFSGSDLDDLIDPIKTMLKYDREEWLDWWSEEQIPGIADIVQNRVLQILKHTQKHNQYLVTYWG